MVGLCLGRGWGGKRRDEWPFLAPPSYAGWSSHSKDVVIPKDGGPWRTPVGLHCLRSLTVKRSFSLKSFDLPRHLWQITCLMHTGFSPFSHCAGHVRLWRGPFGLYLCVIREDNAFHPLHTALSLFLGVHFVAFPACLQNTLHLPVNLTSITWSFILIDLGLCIWFVFHAACIASS